MTNSIVDIIGYASIAIITFYYLILNYIRIRRYKRGEIDPKIFQAARQEIETMRASGLADAAIKGEIIRNLWRKITSLLTTSFLQMVVVVSIFKLVDYFTHSKPHWFVVVTDHFGYISIPVATAILGYIFYRYFKSKNQYMFGLLQIIGSIVVSIALANDLDGSIRGLKVLAILPLAFLMTRGISDCSEGLNAVGTQGNSTLTPPIDGAP
jgi:hypothetical protein